MIRSTSLFLIMVCVLLSSNTLFAQNKRNELESKRANLKKDLEYKSKLLQETAKEKKNSLNHLVLLNKKIKEREELIQTIKTELNLLDEEIAENQRTIEGMQADLVKLKAEYAELIRFANRNRSNYEKIMFVFAAKDFNQAYKRFRYLQEYSSYRKRQAEAIIRLEDNTRQEQQKLIEKKEEKAGLLSKLVDEQGTLASEKEQQNTVYTSLQNKEKELKAEIKKKQEEQVALQKAIERIIAEEIRKAREAAKAKGDKPESKWTLTPEAQALSTNFTSNKGKLPWPVEKGEVTQKFGVHSHPVLSHLKIQNNGLTISTQEGGVARAVFEGEVSKVILIPGAGKAVIIRHGDFLTVYGNLADVYVNSGDKVSTKQKIGTIMTDQGKTDLQFEIRKGQNADTLDPAFWLFGVK